MNNLWIPFALLSAFFGALVTIFAKLGLQKVDTTLATMIRSAFMFLLLFALTAATGKLAGISALKGSALLWIVLAGAAGAASWLCYFWALQVGKASQVGPFERISLVFIIVLAALFLGEKIGVKTAVGAALMMIGAILVAIA